MREHSFATLAIMREWPHADGWVFISGLARHHLRIILRMERKRGPFNYEYLIIDECRTRLTHARRSMRTFRIRYRMYPYLYYRTRRAAAEQE